LDRQIIRINKLLQKTGERVNFEQQTGSEKMADRLYQTV